MATLTSPSRKKTRAPAHVATALCLVEAALVVVSGVIHLHLERTAYLHVKTIGPLFVVQFVSCVVVALVLVASRRLLAALAGAALMAGTVAGFVLARTVGIFGFKLPYSTTLANQVLVVEIVATVIGLFAADLLWRTARGGALR